VEYLSNDKILNKIYHCCTVKFIKAEKIAIAAKQSHIFIGHY